MLYQSSKQIDGTAAHKNVDMSVYSSRKNISMGTDVYCEKYNTVFGFSLSTSDFFGINPRKIINLFKNNPNNEFVYDFTNIPYEVKHIIGEKIDKYMTLYKYFA